MPVSSDRRKWLTYAGAAALSASAGRAWLALAKTQGSRAQKDAGASDKDATDSMHGKQSVKETLAVEDLMREHGVLRRALLVYAEASRRLQRGGGAVPVDALIKTAGLFRKFGEDYHERSLEEQHVFPMLEKQGGPNADLARVLKAQHDRGRQITDYLLAVTRTGRITPTDTVPLADVLAQFVRMYMHHAAIEDTVVFPAWKGLLSGSQYEQLSDQFEALEQRMFGKDGFEDAVRTIGSVEQSFGLANLAALTPPVPPRAAS